MRNIIYFCTCFLLISCSSKPIKTLKVGMELAYPPFETKDAHGNPTGISVDIAHALGEHLGIPVIIENIAWNGLIPSLQTGKIDAVISSMTITEDRKNEVDFSDPYATAYLALLISKKSDIQSVEDLNKPDKILAVKQGTTAYLYAKKYLSNVILNTFTSESAAVTEVIQGKADAFIYDQLTIYRNNVQNPSTTRTVFIPVQNEPDQWGIAVKKGNTELLNKINKFLVDFKKNGGYEKISDKYLKEEKQIFDDMGFKFFF
ncbi:polar amino acid transport system substrate-binding protein [Brevinema andersonii]|uniref:Polar amino acid transport system substrate-binding protein n=1 Tax=Brevinema andersonii TaxID=34097 RepID=A0A1I1FCA3_BREAD|nr:transporter substrate-binding domain-containing protein [Brevinema andersonii]SFB96612.1 polar amino acid transport system substrate-binding protein [Brevinema andersonii]